MSSLRYRRSSAQETPTWLTGFFVGSGSTDFNWRLCIFSASQNAMTSDRSRKQPSALSNVMMGPNLKTERGPATPGVVPLLKDRMGGGGMRPLIIIRPIYREMSSRHESERNASLGKVLLGHCSPSYHACESRRHHRLHSGPSLSQQHSWTTMIVQRMPFFPSSIITVSMQNSRPPGCLMETGPVSEEEEEEEE